MSIKTFKADTSTSGVQILTHADISNDVVISIYYDSGYYVLTTQYPSQSSIPSGLNGFFFITCSLKERFDKGFYNKFTSFSNVSLEQSVVPLTTPSTSAPSYVNVFSVKGMSTATPTDTQLQNYAMKGLISSIRNLPPSEYNRIATGIKNYTAWFLFPYNKQLYCAYTHDLSDAIIGKDGHVSILNTPASPPEGLRYNAGYLQSLGKGTLIKDSGKYIGFNYKDSTLTIYKKTSYSEIFADLDELSGFKYDVYYQLNRSGSGAYLTEVTPTRTPNSDAQGSVAEAIGAFENTLIPPDLDYSQSSTTVVDNFIADFGDWQIIFNPANGVEYGQDYTFMQEDGKNKELRFMLPESAGTVDTLYTSSLIPIYTEEVDADQFLSIIDDCITRSKAAIKGTFDNRNVLPSIVELHRKDSSSIPETISLSDYFQQDDYRGKYNFIYKVLTKDTDGTWKYSKEDKNLDLPSYLTQVNSAIRNMSKKTYEIDLDLEQTPGILNLYGLEMFEAKTRGHDFIQENYTTVRPEERDPDAGELETSRIMTFDDNYFTYKYSGRDIDIFGGFDTETQKEFNTASLPNASPSTLPPVYCGLIHSCDLLQETDVTLGETYGQQEYFIEAIKAPIWEMDEEEDYIKKPSGYFTYKDSFKVKDYLDKEHGGYDNTLYTEDDIEVVTSKIDLLRCKYYSPTSATFENNWCDCNYITKDDKAASECLYQKLGYCPYRFSAEKHPRRIRTLQQSKSNRFNLIQELSKVFEIYPNFDIQHEANGKIKLNAEGQQLKNVYFTTQKGNDILPGFRYEKNLKDIGRTTDSSSITTKLYVENVDSSLSKDGVCSIQKAEDNIGKNSYILDFSYYVKIGQLDGEQVQRDLYGIDKNDFSFLPRIGAYNSLYDKYSNLIITMTGETLNELEAQNIVSIEGIGSSLEERKKVGQSMYQYKTSYTAKTSQYTTQKSYTTSDSYKNYVKKYREHTTILWGLVEQLFFSNNYFSVPVKKTDDTEEPYYDFYVVDASKSWDDQSPATKENAAQYKNFYNTLRQKNYCNGELFWRLLLEGLDGNIYTPPFNKWQDFKENIVEKKLYEINGTLGEYKSLYNEVKYWKNERAKILNKINDLSEQFYKKYEPYIKEGTFTNQNYLTDNEYYWAGVQVLDDSAEPKLSYTINVIDISAFKDCDIYDVDLGDTTYVEDIDFFGVDKHTGLPNKEKVYITEITYDLDNVSNTSIGVKNYQSRFDNLFQSISASVQSLTFNENVYKRASNFTAKQYITTESLQDTLDVGDLTLLDTAKQNILLDESGTQGNDINNTASQYKQTGEGIFFSTDGGETWDIGVGPKGINLDYAKFGKLDSSKIQIVDGSYIYFLWDKDGINAYRNPATSTDGLKDFARFNRYGLSLIEKDNVRLRVGYEYLSNIDGQNLTGNYKEELPLKDQNIGFYLYNDSGQPIFKTETRSSYKEDESSDYTARLSLTGEIFVTNKVLDTATNGGNTTKMKKLSDRWTFSNSTDNTPKNPTNISRTIMYHLIKNYLASNTDYCITYNDLLVGSITLTKQQKTESGITTATYSADKPIKLYQISHCIIPTDYITVTSYTVDQFKLISPVNSGTTFPNSITISNETMMTNIINGSYNPKDYSDIFDDNARMVLSQTSNSFSDFFVTGPTSGASTDYHYTENDIGKVIQATSKLVLVNRDEKATVTISKPSVNEVVVNYYDSPESTVVRMKSLYLYVQNGEYTYWGSYDDDDSLIANSDYSTNELGVFINNKKSLNDSKTDYIERTNTDSQKITKDMSKDELFLRQQAFLSGAERTFMIASAGVSGNELACNNVLSILKNGVLYMGGTVADYYGNKLNISGLQYMPDEVRIMNPTILMSNTGQIWCDWTQFYCAFEKDGIMNYTSFSLMDFMNAMKNWSNTVSGVDNVPIEGMYLDEDSMIGG